MATNYDNEPKKYTACFFKMATGLPCPSCGATRSLIEILKGDIAGAVQWNPIGFILLLLMIALPAWMLYDGIGKKDSFYRFYHRFEVFMRKKSVYIPAMALIIINWIWNIHKGL